MSVTTAARRITRVARESHRERGTQLGFSEEGHLVEVVPAGMWLTTDRYAEADYWVTAGPVTQADVQRLLDATASGRARGLSGAALDEYVDVELYQVAG